MTTSSTPSLPSGYRLRAATLDDSGAVAGLWRAIDVARYGSSDVTVGQVVEEWSLPRLSLADDVWLVESAAGDVVGYGLFWMENPPHEVEADQRVHAAHRGRGISEVLLKMGVARARSAARDAPERRVSLGVYSAGLDEARLTLLERHGFVRERVFLRMDVVLDHTLREPSLPAGIVLRTFRRGQDERAVHEAMEEAFKDHFRPAPMSLDEWETLRFSRPELETGLWFVAWDGEEVAGAVLAFVTPEGGYVDELAVRRPWRGRGLGRALLLREFAELRTRGLRLAYLGVDSINPTGAMRVYEGAGMKPSREHVYLTKEIRAE